MMILNKINIRNNGKFIITKVPEEYCECLFVFQQFRFFFSMHGNRYSPANLADVDATGLPDYVLNLMHQLVVAHAILVDLVGLPDIFKEGRFYDVEFRYLDIYLDDIPVKHGIASANAYSSSEPILRDSSFEGQSIKLILHRELGKKTLTPLHELFHIFQYAMTPFNNVWFMEGLARWAQQLMQLKPAKGDTLPLNNYEIQLLLNKWHEAESFWIRLDQLCMKKSKRTLPKELAECGLVINTQVAYGGFVQAFLKDCNLQTKCLMQEQKARELVPGNEWERLEKRSANNNPYIFRAIVNAIVEQNPPLDPELDAFLKLAKNYAYSGIELFDTFKIQSLMTLLRKLEIGKVFNQDNPFQVTNYFEPVTGTLSWSKVSLHQKFMSEKDFQALWPIRNLIGTLDISNFDNITVLTGLDNIESIEGDLIISGTSIHHLDGFNRLKRVKGKIILSNNLLLRQINGFNSLQTIDQELVISENPQLEVLNGFNSLSDVKKGVLKIENCKKLATINGFSSLKRTNGITLNSLGISNINFLKNLFHQHPHYNGAIKITSTKLSNLDGLASLVSTTSSLYLHANQLENLCGLESLVEVGASLSLSSNYLADISQLKKLTRVNGMLGLAYNKLKSLDGLENLKYLKSVNWNQQQIRTLVIQGNPQLINLNALKNILEANKNLVVYTDNLAQYKVYPEPTAPFYQNGFQVYDTSLQNLVESNLIEFSCLKEMPVILFPSMGPSWTLNILKNTFCHALIFDFKDVGTVISFCKKNYINIIFPTTISSTKFLLKYRNEFLQAGINFLIPENDVLNILQNKLSFYKAMKDYGFGNFIPEIYENIDQVKFPCIKKNVSSSGGKHQVIIHKKEDIGNEASDAEVFCEYFKGNTEYATNIMYADGKALYCVTFEKKANSEFYILGTDNNKYDTVENKLVSTPFIDTFEKILALFKYKGFCCFDYKIVDGIPKIFEINPRLGYSNTLDKEALFNSIQAYYRAVLNHNS